MARRYVPHRLGTAGGFDGLPPGGAIYTRETGKGPDRLTPKFNAAAKGKRSFPPSMEQVEALKKKMSRAAHTAEMTPFGNVIGSYDPKRDRQIRENIKAVQTALSKRSDMARKAFTKAALQNTAKKDFNRSAGIRM